MPASLTEILRATRQTLAAWAGEITPAGSVTLASDEIEGYELMRLNPNGWNLFLWCGGERPKSGVADDHVDAQLRIGLAMARGLARDGQQTDLLDGRGNLPGVLDTIEGVIRTARGLHLAATAPADAAASCFLLTFTGWDWVRYEVGVPHYVVQMNFSLSRQFKGRLARRVTLS